MKEVRAILTDKVQTPELVEPRGKVSVMEGLKLALASAALRHFYTTGGHDLFREGIAMSGPGAVSAQAKEPSEGKEFTGQGAEA